MLNQQNHPLLLLHPRHWKHQYLYHIQAQHIQTELHHHQFLVKPSSLLQPFFLTRLCCHYQLCAIKYINQKSQCYLCGNDDHYLAQMHYFRRFIEFLSLLLYIPNIALQQC